MPSRASRWLGAGIVALLLAPVLLSAQQQQNTPQTVVILFMGEINTASVNQLLSIVSGQIRSGTPKIRIVISSGGGDLNSAFTAYNFLRNMPAEITTFNVGNVDSAAVVLYCAGSHRYSLPATRFLIHGTSLNIVGNVSVTMDASALQGHLEVLKNLNQTFARVVASRTNKKESEIENALRGQIILTPEEAKSWDLVQEIKNDFMEPGAVLISVGGQPPAETKSPLEFRSVSPSLKFVNKIPSKK